MREALDGTRTRRIFRFERRHDMSLGAFARQELRKFLRVVPLRLTKYAAWLAEWPLSLAGVVEAGPSVIIVATPRSGSTLRFNLIAWNTSTPREVVGSGENKASYRDGRDLRRLRVRSMLALRTRKLPTMVADKIVEPYFTVADEVLADDSCRFIVIRRSADAAVESIERLLNVTAEDARLLHDTQLAQVERVAEQAAHCLAIDYQDLVGGPRATLDAIGAFLELERPLAETYEVSRFANSLAYGDVSDRLKTGRIEGSGSS